MIYLAALGDFHLLESFFEAVVIPPVVYEEVVTGGGDHPVAQAVAGARGFWIRVQPLKDPTQYAALIRSYGLHAGEAEAILLAGELNPDSLLMDDTDGIRCAHGRRLNTLRTTAIYQMAKDRGLIGAVAPKLDQLRSAGFRLRDEHYDLILKKAGERPQVAALN